MSNTPAQVTRGAAWKIVASVVVVTGAVVFLMRGSLKEEVQAFKEVDEVTSNVQAMRGRKLQVHGYVVIDSIEQRPGTLQYRFKIQSHDPRPHAEITALYTGLVPDTFKSRAEVVASGKLGEGDVLDVIPDGIMAKCPSKYKVEEGKAAPMDPAAAKQL